MAQQLLDPVRFATNEDINLSATYLIGSTKIDGLIIRTNDRLLVKSQSNPVQNGVYVFNSNGTLSRASDCLAGLSTKFLLVYVSAGNLFKNTGWLFTSQDASVVNTAQLNFIRISTNTNYDSDDTNYSLTFRNEKGYPLSNEELDSNFQYIAKELLSKVNLVDYNADIITGKLNDDLKVATWTATNSSAVTLTYANHGLSNGDSLIVNFKQSSGENATSGVYVAASVTTNTFAISNSINGALTTITGSGTAHFTRSLNALNAFYVRDLDVTEEIPSNLPSSTKKPQTIPVRNEDGQIKANTFKGDLIGNADTATRATDANSADSLLLSYTVPVLQGGTGARSAVDARANLTVLYRGAEGDSMLGKLTLVSSSTSRASLNIPAGTAPTNPSHGDIWTTSSSINARVGSTNYSLAPLDSPMFTGSPQLVVAVDNSNALALNANNNRFATTEWTQRVRTDLVDNVISLKANIASPTFTGAPLAPTPTDNSTTTRISTTGYVETRLENYTTLTQNALKANIASPTFTGAPLAPTPTDNSTTTRISTTGYVQSVRTDLVDNVISLKANIASPTFTGTPLAPTPGDNSTTTRISTTGYVETRLSNYTTTTDLQTYYATKVYVDDRQPKWGDSRKFVQVNEPVDAVNGDFWIIL